MKTIKIQCKGADTLPLDAVVEFQGNLKKRGKKEIDLMIKSIEQYGFSFPFHIWQNGGQNHCLDGHGRILALAEMRKRGVDLPLFPVVYVDAKDEAEAKNKLLRLNSQYGQMTIDSVLEFTDGIEVVFDELALPDSTLSFDGEGSSAQEEKIDEEYTRKIKAPNYEPKNEKPAIASLFDEEKTKALIEEINGSKITEDEKLFLIHAANRHRVFDYRNIADYYAHASKEVQELMEKSALVIIDFNKAIENGYVKLSKEIQEQYQEDYPDGSE